MGAVIGGLLAIGLDPEEIDAICFDEWVQRRPLSDYTLPRHALIRGDRFRAMLQRSFGEIQIEELPRSFVCAYTELRAGRLVVARHGSLREQVGYSICLPVIAPPKVNGREIYIDGSLIDNLPVSAIAELAEGPLIAVDVKASFDRRREPAIRRASRRPAAPDAPAKRARTPSLGETLTRVLLLGSANTSQSGRQADLVIRPQAVGVGLLEFHQLDVAREAGRAAAREALDRRRRASSGGCSSEQDCGDRSSATVAESKQQGRLAQVVRWLSRRAQASATCGCCSPAWRCPRPGAGRTTSPCSRSSTTARIRSAGSARPGSCGSWLRCC